MSSVAEELSAIVNAKVVAHPEESIYSIFIRSEGINFKEDPKIIPTLKQVLTVKNGTISPQCSIFIANVITSTNDRDCAIEIIKSAKSNPIPPVIYCAARLSATLAQNCQEYRDLISYFLSKPKVDIDTAAVIYSLYVYTKYDTSPSEQLYQTMLSYLSDNRNKTDLCDVGIVKTVGRIARHRILPLKSIFKLLKSIKNENKLLSKIISQATAKIAYAEFEKDKESAINILQKNHNKMIFDCFASMTTKELALSFITVPEALESFAPFLSIQEKNHCITSIFSKPRTKESIQAALALTSNTTEVMAVCRYAADCAESDDFFRNLAQTSGEVVAAVVHGMLEDVGKLSERECAVVSKLALLAPNANVTRIDASKITKPTCQLYLASAYDISIKADDIISKMLKKGEKMDPAIQYCLMRKPSITSQVVDYCLENIRHLSPPSVTSLISIASDMKPIIEYALKADALPTAFKIAPILDEGMELPQSTQSSQIFNRIADKIGRMYERDESILSQIQLASPTLQQRILLLKCTEDDKARSKFPRGFLVPLLKSLKGKDHITIQMTSEVIAAFISSNTSFMKATVNFIETNKTPAATLLIASLGRRCKIEPEFIMRLFVTAIDRAKSKTLQRFALYSIRELFSGQRFAEGAPLVLGTVNDLIQSDASLSIVTAELLTGLFKDISKTEVVISDPTVNGIARMVAASLACMPFGLAKADAVTALGGYSSHAVGLKSHSPEVRAASYAAFAPSSFSMRPNMNTIAAIEDIMRGIDEQPIITMLLNAPNFEFPIIPRIITSRMFGDVEANQNLLRISYQIAGQAASVDAFMNAAIEALCRATLDADVRSMALPVLGTALRGIPKQAREHYVENLDVVLDFAFANIESGFDFMVEAMTEGNVGKYDEPIKSYMRSYNTELLMPLIAKYVALSPTPADRICETAFAYLNQQIPSIIGQTVQVTPYFFTAYAKLRHSRESAVEDRRFVAHLSMMAVTQQSADALMALSEHFECDKENRDILQETVEGLQYATIVDFDAYAKLVDKLEGDVEQFLQPVLPSAVLKSIAIKRPSIVAAVNCFAVGMLSLDEATAIAVLATGITNYAPALDQCQATGQLQLGLSLARVIAEKEGGLADAAEFLARNLIEGAPVIAESSQLARAAVSMSDFSDADAASALMDILLDVNDAVLTRAMLPAVVGSAGPVEKAVAVLRMARDSVEDFDAAWESISEDARQMFVRCL